MNFSRKVEKMLPCTSTCLASYSFFPPMSTLFGKFWGFAQIRIRRFRWFSAVSSRIFGEFGEGFLRFQYMPRMQDIMHGTKKDLQIPRPSLFSVCRKISFKPIDKDRKRYIIKSVFLHLCYHVRLRRKTIAVRAHSIGRYASCFQNKMCSTGSSEQEPLRLFTILYIAGAPFEQP